MFQKKRLCLMDEAESQKRECTDDEDLQGEDEAEGSNFRTHFHCEHAGRTFSTVYTSYSNDFSSGYQFPQNSYCGAPTMNARENLFYQDGGALGQDEDLFLHNKTEDVETRMLRKTDAPLFFLGDTSFSSSHIDPREIYCTVPGRTSLLSSTTKYRVTVGEIQRRISAPECLNASLLGGILRKAKSKDGGKTLRDSLKKIGLTLPAGRRKQTNITAWTALVEEEAVHMARDFAVICEKEFHAREIGTYLTKAFLAVENDVLKRRAMLEHSKKIVTELAELLSADRTVLTPFVINPTPPRPTPLLDQHIQHHLSHFTLMTHGFGTMSMITVLNSLRDVIDEGIRYIDRACHSHVYIAYQRP